MTDGTLKLLKEQEKEHARADNKLQIENERLAERLALSVTREEVQSMIDRLAEQYEKRLLSVMDEKLRANNTQLGEAFRAEIKHRVSQDYPKPKQISPAVNKVSRSDANRLRTNRPSAASQHPTELQKPSALTHISPNMRYPVSYTALEAWSNPQPPREKVREPDWAERLEAIMRRILIVMLLFGLLALIALVIYHPRTPPTSPSALGTE
jgi:hypothetical protein